MACFIGAIHYQLSWPHSAWERSTLSHCYLPIPHGYFCGKHGWLKLFWLMYVLTSIGAVITGPGSIEGFLYMTFSHNPLIGVPEITL